MKGCRLFCLSLEALRFKCIRTINSNMITEEELRTLLPLMETAWVEKTETVPNTLRANNDRVTHKFAEAVCAFANDLVGRSAPGYFIFGVADDGTVVNQEPIREGLQQAILSFRTDGRIIPQPAIQVKIFTLNEGTVLVVEVPPSLYPPVRYRDRIWIRVGPRKETATVEEERRLTEKRISQARTYDLLPCLGSRKDDLDMSYVRRTYVPLLVSQEDLDENGRTIEEQLGSVRMYDRQYSCPTNAAVLLFGQTLAITTTYFPGSYIQYIRFDGNDLLDTPLYDHRIEGNIIQQLEEIKRFIEINIIRRYQREITEEQHYNYPLIALLEFIYNAIIHRDYASNAPIRFYHFNDRIEIQSPGGLYGQSNPENFPNANDYRNPVLAEAAFKLGYVQQFNLGVRKAEKALEKNDSPAPEYDINQSSYFLVIIKAHENHNTVQ